MDESLWKSVIKDKNKWRVWADLVKNTTLNQKIPRKAEKKWNEKENEMYQLNQKEKR